MRRIQAVGSPNLCMRTSIGTHSAHICLAYDRVNVVFASGDSVIQPPHSSASRPAYGRPTLTPRGFDNRLLCHPKAIGKDLGGLSTAPNLLDLLRVQNAAKYTPILGVHIGHVIRLRAEEQMPGVNTTRIVAAVQNEQPALYGADVKHVRQSMREKPLTARIHGAVACLYPPRAPLPARFAPPTAKIALEPRKDSWIVVEQNYIVDVHSKPLHGFGCQARSSAANAPWPLFSTPSFSMEQAG